MSDTVPGKEPLRVKDESDGSFTNEALWRKVFWELLAYFAYGCFIAISIQPVLGFDAVAFVTCIKVSMLPLVISALKGQARNKEIQEQLRKEDDMAGKEKEMRDVEKQMAEKDKEIISLKMDLIRKTEQSAAIREALEKEVDSLA
jgi:uncharacterized protein YlxW (UPF0749 family)